MKVREYNNCVTLNGKRGTLEAAGVLPTQRADPLMMLAKGRSPLRLKLGCHKRNTDMVISSLHPAWRESMLLEHGQGRQGQTDPNRPAFFLRVQSESKSQGQRQAVDPLVWLRGIFYRVLLWTAVCSCKCMS